MKALNYEATAEDNVMDYFLIEILHKGLLRDIETTAQEIVSLQERKL